MTSLRVPLPEPFDLVPVEEVERLVAETDREFQLLERRAADAVAAAEAAERRQRELAWDDTTSTWTIVRLQRFLDQLRHETEQERAAILEVAELRARLIVREAELREPFTPSASLSDLDAALFGAGPAPVEVVPPIVVVPPVEVAAPVATIAPIAIPAVLPVPVPTPIPEPVAAAPIVAPEVLDPPTLGFAPLTAAPEAPAAPAAAPVTGPAAQPEFWIVEDAVERRRFAPLAALLEIAAVLLILVFILIRLS